jgi:hypothetical protein
MTTWLDRSHELVAPVLVGLAIALFLALIGLVIWRVVDEIRFRHRQRVIARYRPLVSALLGAAPDAGAVARLASTPTRHRDLQGELLLGTLRLTTGDVVPRLREAARSLGLIDRWTRALDDRRWWIRAAAVRALGLVREPGIVDRLLLALDERDEEVRAAAVDALGRIGDPRCAAALLARLRDGSRHQRTRVVEAIRALGPPIVPVLLNHARDYESDAAMTIDILGVVGGTAALENLLDWTASPDAAVRAAALRAIGSVGLDDRGFFYALRGLDDVEPDVRGMAARGLGRSGKHAAVPYLASHLDDDWIVAAHCATGLRRLGRPGAAALEHRAASPGQGGDLAKQMLWELTFQKAGA